jgi:hypothetical protein
MVHRGQKEVGGPSIRDTGSQLVLVTGRRDLVALLVGGNSHDWTEMGLAAATSICSKGGTGSDLLKGRVTLGV